MEKKPVVPHHGLFPLFRDISLGDMFCFRSLCLNQLPDLMRSGVVQACSIDDDRDTTRNALIQAAVQLASSCRGVEYARLRCCTRVDR